MASDEAAKWRLRVKRRNDIFYELNKIGPIAALLGGSLLLYPNKLGVVKQLDSYQSWKQTLEESAMYNALNKQTAIYFSHLPYDEYSRVEEGVATLGRILALSVEDMADPLLLEACAHLKKWCVEQTVATKSADTALEYLKWTAKAAQAAFLQTAVPDLPGKHPGKFLGCIVPFIGPLSFVSNMLLGKTKRSLGLQLEEARSMAQYASMTRALPYPSSRQVKESIEKTINLISKPAPSLGQDTKALYKQGLSMIKQHTKPAIRLDTHVSLSASGCFENSRSEGGRGLYLVRLAKQACNVSLSVETVQHLSGRRDVFGYQPITPFNASVIIRHLTSLTTELKLGHFLYRDIDGIMEALSPSFDGKQVPIELGKILNLVASNDLLTYGSYSRTYESYHGMLLFDEKEELSEFIPSVTALPVRAEVSIEAGLKTRLVTGAVAAYVHFGQQLSHILRDYLGSDPFLRVGFDEADKLWEVLAQYRKDFIKKNQALSQSNA
jgi:hypothetical protein